MASDIETSTLHFNVRDHGAVGDGTTDDTAAIEAAVKAAGNHGTVFFPRGRFRITRTITMPIDQIWQGSGIAESGVPQDRVDNGILIDTPEGVPGIDANYNAVFRDLHIRGNDRSTGLYVHGRAHLENVNLQHHAVAIRAEKLWYGHFQAVRLYRNAVGIDITNSYNLTIVEPRFYCVDHTDRPGIGIQIGRDVDIKVFGGCIEGFRRAITIEGDSSLHLYSTYFESSPRHTDYGADRGATMVSAVGARKTSISAIGCFVVLQHARTFIDVSGRDTDVSLVGMNNHFRGGNALGSGWQHMAYRWDAASRARLHLTADRWDVDFPENTLYMPPQQAVTSGSVVMPPAGAMQGHLDGDVLLTGANVRVQSAPLTLGRVTTLPAFSRAEVNDQVGAVVYHIPSNRPVVFTGRQWTYFDGTDVPLTAGDRARQAQAALADVPLGPIPLKARQAKRFLARQVKRWKEQRAQR